MLAKDYRDIAGGIALILVGTFAAVYALRFLRVGTISQMGPGMFPAALGVILVIFGVAILVPALFRSGESLHVNTRSFVVVSASILAFALIVRPFGLIPAVVVMTLIASRANDKLSLIGALILAACLSAVATLIFWMGLGLPLDAVNWPW